MALYYAGDAIREAFRAMINRLWTGAQGTLGIMTKMNISVAEVGRQDAWQFAELAFVTVASTRDVVDKRLSVAAGRRADGLAES